MSRKLLKYGSHQLSKYGKGEILEGDFNIGNQNYVLKEEEARYIMIKIIIVYQNI